MPRRTTLPTALLAALAAGPRAAAADPTADRAAVTALLQAHCVKCHGPDKQAGDVRVDDLPADPAKAADRWAAVRDQVRDGLMPPAKEPKPDPAAVRRLVAWTTAGIAEQPPRLPNHGNLVPHELLFGPTAAAAEPPPPRIWRLSPDGYKGWVNDLFKERMAPLTAPFVLVPDRGVRDFAGLYAVDEPATEILLRNAETIVDHQTGRVAGKVVRQGTIPEFVKLMDPDAVPTKAQLEAAVQTQFRLAIGRKAAAADVDRLVALYEKCVAEGDRPAAAKTMLQAVLLKSDAMFRSELGGGTGTRRMLAPDELARAVSLAVGHRLDAKLAAAAGKGELTTPEQVAAHARRLLDEPPAKTPRLLGFFREYFEYHKAGDVFKDKPDDIVHVPGVLVSDTDRLVLHVLAADKDVLAELLTTRRSFVNYRIRTAQDGKPAPAYVLANDGTRKNVEAVYGLKEFVPDQPVELSGGERLGVLMQPSWLVAWSTNFDNDPVRRGRWIRERLLGGTVPDLPIGVAAQVPDEPDQPYRHRLRVTREGRCWTCHQKMDDLGLPFEQFDHYGRFRTAEKVLDPEATAKNVEPKGKKSKGPVHKGVPLDVTGKVPDSGEPGLDGPVKDPYELVKKLAASPRARQVFVRHAFRYFLGRNESLADARTLQAADRAYVESGGSFKALVVSLLTSDAFLYRSAPNGVKK